MNKQQAAYISIISNSLLIALKVVAGIMMGSVSVISEAIHSCNDLIASIVAFFSIKKALVPADEDHAFGHGKYENVSGAFEAILIFIAAVMIINEAVKKFAHGTKLENLDAGIIVMMISAIVNYFVAQTLFKVSKKTDSIALEADAWHLWTDVITSAGVMSGLIVIKFSGWAILDPIIAILVALIIIKAAVELTIKSLKDLVDKSLPQDEIDRIKQTLDKFTEIVSYHKLRTRKSGDRREIDVHLQLPKNTSLSKAHDLCFRVESAVKQCLTNAHIVIHVEPDDHKRHVMEDKHPGDND